MRDDPRNFLGSNHNTADESRSVRRLIYLSAQRSMERTFVSGQWHGFELFNHNQFDVFMKLGLAIGEVDINTVVVGIKRSKDA